MQRIFVFRVFRFCCPPLACKNAGPYYYYYPQNHKTCLEIPAIKPNSKLVVFLTTNSLPPPEWIDPFVDLSGLTSNANSELKPSPWVNQILSILLDTSNPSMQSNLDSFCHTYMVILSPNFVSFILKDEKLKANPCVALEFFTWAATQKRYKHSLDCYVSLIDVLACNGDVSEVKIVFPELSGMGLLMTASAANSLIKIFGGLGMVEELLWVWRAMKDNGIQPSLFTYNFLLNGLVNSKYIESAERVFEVMENGRIGPDIVTYNTMIKGYYEEGRVQKAMEVFNELEIRNIAADKITYMTLIQAC